MSMYNLVMNKKSNNDKSNSNNCVIYIYAKNDDLAERQLSIMKNYCRNNMINYKKIIIDINNINSLKTKINLINYLKRNDNFNLLILKDSRLCRNYQEMQYIIDYCTNHNIKVFDISKDNCIVNYIYLEKNKKNNDLEI